MRLLCCHYETRGGFGESAQSLLDVMADQLTDEDPTDRLWGDVHPERLHELSDLLDQYTDQFRPLDDQCGFSLQAGAYGTIQYTERSFHQLWLFGFGGMKSLHCCSSFICILRMKGANLCISDIDLIPGQSEANQAFTQFM